MTGKQFAQEARKKAQELKPNDVEGQAAFLFGYVAGAMRDNKQPNGKPWPAEFWRSAGREFERQIWSK